jgi:signal transduction histidine kinase
VWLDPVPIASRTPVVVFAAIRFLIGATGLVCLAFVDFPHEGRIIAVCTAIALPWALLVLLVSLRWPGRAVTPLVALGDIAVLCVALALVPELGEVIRYIGLFCIAAHAHFQGERRGLVIAALGAGAIIVVSELSPTPTPDNLAALYDALYAICALAVAVVVGRLRTAESQERLRAEEAARRTLAAEDAIRRRVATSLHDGPVQQLVSLDLALAASERAAQGGEAERAGSTLAEARRLAHDAVAALRDDIVSLGREQLDDIPFQDAVERLAPVWRQRYGIDVDLDLEPVDLSPVHAGALFGIAREAVVNAGRHAEASRVTVLLRRCEEGVELRVGDDGRGPHVPRPRHGLRGIVERAAALGGRAHAGPGGDGFVVVAELPVPAP